MTEESIVERVTIIGYNLRGAWLTATGYVVDDAVTNGGETYVCILDHTSGAGDEPGVGGSWTTYWVLVDYIESDIFSIHLVMVGILHMPTAWTAADIGFLASPTVDGTFLPLYDESGNLVVLSIPSVDSAYVLPLDLTGVLFAKLWSNTAGANEAQGADRVFNIDLKVDKSIQ